MPHNEHPENPVPNRLKAILKQRKAAKMYPSSYASLAVCSNVSKNTVVFLARGDYFPKLDTAYKIARALNMTVYDIWSEVETRRFLNEITDDHADLVIAAMKGEYDEAQE
jgi:DNA-binding XRE family transcriptional regulator